MYVVRIRQVHSVEAAMVKLVRAGASSRLLWEEPTLIDRSHGAEREVVAEFEESEKDPMSCAIPPVLWPHLVDPYRGLVRWWREFRSGSQAAVPVAACRHSASVRHPLQRPLGKAQ